jgi:3-(3-hydroxy-phenyl)propionate hydroxylase
MIFQNLLEDFEGKLNLLDDILPDKPVLIIFSRKPERAVCEKLLFDIGNEGASIIGITPEDTKAIKTMLPIFRDKSRHFSRKPYPYYLDYVLLLRRDRYIAASCKIENIDDMRPKIKTLTSAIEN